MSEEKTIDQRLEEKATEFGWQPDGELDAVEFLARGNQFHLDMKQTVDDLKKENAKVYKIVAEHVTNTSKKEFEAQRQSLDEKIEKAKEEGDAESAAALAEQKGALKEPVVADPKMEFLENWQKSQSWWDNPEMRKDAVGFYNAEVYESGVDDPEDILPKVEAKIKKIHAEYFEPKNPNRDKASGDPGTAKKPKDEIDMNDFDEEERAHIDQFVKMGMKPEKLIESVKNLRKQRAV